jgi:hypothetical protein
MELQSEAAEDFADNNSTALVQNKIKKLNKVKTYEEEMH